MCSFGEIIQFNKQITAKQLVVLLASPYSQSYVNAKQWETVMIRLEDREEAKWLSIMKESIPISITALRYIEQSSEQMDK